MSVTLEQVQEEAKKLGIELSDDQAKSYVTLNMLPVKQSGSSKDEDDGDGDEDEVDLDDLKDEKLTKAIRKRINGLNEKRKAERKEAQKLLAEMKKQLKEFQDSASAKDDDQKKKQGKYEELLKKTEEKEKKLEGTFKQTKERLMNTEISAALKSALIDQGVRKDRLSKALKLFDFDSIDFDWTDEESLEFEIGDFSPEVESFKKEWPEFFADGDDDQNGDNWTPRKGKKTFKSGGKEKEKQKAELENKFPALRRVS